MASGEVAVSQMIRDAAHPLDGSSTAYDPLMALIGDAPIVLLGEASHGTHDFYEHRARITQRLIEERGFNIVAVEADWPDAFRVNRFVRGMGADGTAEAALGDFQRFPRWMWRNTVVRDFLEWLRAFNAPRSPAQQCGFYGVDLYSMYTSMAAVLEYLEGADPEAATRARHRYSCFDHFGQDSQSYGYAATFGIRQKCEEQAITQLVELRRQAGSPAGRDRDQHFYAEQNARLVKNAEEYYRAMFQGSDLSWNLRDKHMAETIDELIAHYRAQGLTPKVVVWEHNSHLGDARFTENGQRGQLNVGQLMRERYGDQARLIGFTTHCGSVTAAHDWDEPAHLMRVRPSRPDSYEYLMRQAGLPAFYLRLRRAGELAAALRLPRLERAIGVIYRPETERQSHYFLAQLPDQFDAILHIDESRAVEPLERGAGWWATAEPAPETFPSGL